jgi:DNA invertase Pin-like site-specific DNA recombinase
MNKPLLYLRTSTKDQNPELQKQQGIEFCIQIGLGEPEVFREKGSAYKIEKVRPVWESVLERAKTEKRDIVVWHYDRSFRNKLAFYEFMKVMFEYYGIKVYSVMQPSIIMMWKMIGKEHTDNVMVNELMRDIFKAMFNFLIRQAGEEAQEESDKKSQRVRNAVRKEEGITKSYKGNKWGRKVLGKKVVGEIIKFYKEGKNLRQISNEVVYWDKNNHKKNVSLGYVHKIIGLYKEGEIKADEDFNNGLINEPQQDTT